MKKILSILICVLLGVTTIYAADFTWNPEIKVTVSPHNESTGQGQITLTNTTPSVSVGQLLSTESITLSDNPSYTSTGLETVNRNNYKTISADLSATFTPNLSVASHAGSYFDGWANALDGEVLPTITIGSINSTAKAKGQRTGWFLNYQYSWTLNGAVTPATVTIYAKFTARTYHAKWPKVVIVTKDAAGNVINTEVGGSISVTLKNGNTGTQAGVTGSKTYVYPETTPAEVFTQTADDRGEWAKASYIWNIVANTKNENYFVESLTYNSTSIASGTDNANFTDREVGVNEPKQDVITVVFKQTFTAHYEGPSIAYASNSATNGSITIGSETPITQVGKTINLKSQQGSVKDLLTYQYTYTAANTDLATFVGWSLNADGSNVIEASKGQLSYTHTFTITAGNYGTAEQPLTTPTLYAVYESFYYRQPVLKFATGASGFGKIAVTKDGNAPENNSDAWKTEDIECGTEMYQLATLGLSKRQINYYYHAQPVDGKYFVCFAKDVAGTTVLSEYVNCNILAEISSKDKNNPTTCPDPVYALFRENTPYYFKGASVGFTENGEKGRITLTGYTVDKDGNIKEEIYQGESDNAMIDDSENTYATQLDVRDYKYTYSAENLYPELTTFKGWSRSPRGGNIISEETSHTETYSSHATTPEGALAPAPLYAVFQSYWYKDATATAVGAGQVVVNDEQTTPEEGWGVNSGTGRLNRAPADNEALTFTAWYHAKPNFGAYFAGWSLVNDTNSIAEVITDNPYKKVYNVTATDDEAPFIPARLYAIFNSVIQVIQKDRMIYYVDVNGHKNINDANVIVNFNKASTLTATLKDNHDIFQLSDKQQVQKGSSITLDASAGISHLVLSYIGDDPESHIGKTATITLSSAYKDEDNVLGTAIIDVQITIENMPYMSFLPTDGKGAYTINQTSGNGIKFKMEKDATTNCYVDISQENMATFELNITEIAAGYSFVGWQMIVDNVATYFSTNTKCTHTFTQSAYVRPVFTEINNDLGVFTIIGDETNHPYVDLQLALDEAKARYDKDANTPKSTQVVVFSNNGEIEGVLKQGHYTIPQGVMLLIPGVGPEPIQVEKKRGDKTPSIFGGWINDPFLMTEEKDLENGKNKYVYREKRNVTISENKTGDVVLFTDDYTDVRDGVTSSQAPYATCYRKLIVEDNTTFTVEDGGCIQLYSVLARSGQLYDASPYRYGQIELGENCRIDVEDGATLHAFGYITGAPSSRVTAYDGAEVHEVFQYSDPRGGKSVAHLYLFRDKYKVFPYSQYYIQNIEVPLEIQYGATEYVTTAADVLKAFVLMSEFIIPENGDLAKTGLFRLGENTSFLKQYDPHTDRLNITIQGKSADASARFGFIKVEMGDLTPIVGDMIKEALGGGFGGNLGAGFAQGFLDKLKSVNLDSRDYVLPMNNNMDFVLDNINVSFVNEVAFLAGTTLKLNEGATINLESGSKVYLYDADENKHPNENIGYFSAGNNKLLPLRFTPNLTHLSNPSNFEYKDANLKRKIAAVKDAKWIVDGTINVKGNAEFYTTAGKAQIISTNKGQVKFASALTTATTYQAKYASGDVTGLIQEEGVNNKIAFQVTSAYLQNADGSHVATTQNTYTYDPAQGKWITDAPSTTIQGDDVLVTMPDYDLSTEDIVDPLQMTLMSSLLGVSTATISWNGAAAVNIVGITNDAASVRIPLAYTPTNKAGEYEGLVSINNGAYYQRVNVVEDYTPRFTNIPQVYTTAYLGYSSAPINLDIMPEVNNVAGILTGKYMSDWSYTMLGANADEFTFTWGEDDNMLRGANIVFRPKSVGNKTAQLVLTCTYTDAADVKHTTSAQVPLTAVANTLTANNLAFATGIEHIYGSDNALQLFADATGNGQPISIDLSANDVVTIAGENKGTYDATTATITPLSDAVGKQVTITATQEADLVNGIAATTISKTIVVTDDIVWNWERLYFGSENISPVTTKYNEWTLTIAEIVDTDNDGQPDKDDEENVIIANPHPGVLDLEEIDLPAKGDYKVTLANWEEGKTYVWFAFNYMDGEDEKIKYFKSEIYRDPRFLSISVNDDYIYEAVTVAIDKITYNDGTVTFNSDNNQTSSWTFYFRGIPDLLSFTAEGENNWQIEESSNGTNWSIAYTWAPIAEGIPFELALQPATRYVRISYATGANPEGRLSNISVSELKTIRADVDKLYMPIIDGGVTKNVVFTYVSENGYQLSTSHDFFTTDLDENKLPGLNIDPFYVVKRVGVNSAASENDEVLGSLNVDNTETRIPIQTFRYPQAIPVQLASDHLERFYFVTSEAYKTTWNADKRAVVMNNAVADASPYVVFHFADSPVPGVISFNFPTTANGSWEVHESSDATRWTPLAVNPTQNIGNGFVMQDFQYPTTSRFVRVKYVSDYAEVVELTNLSILPTTSVTVNPYELEVYDDKNEKVTVTANNLKQVSFNISEGFQIVNESGNPTNFESIFTTGGTISSDIYIDYTGDASATYGELTITTTKDAEGNPIAKKVLATVKLTGLKRNLTNGNTGIKTGVPDDYKINGFDKVDNYAEAKYRDVVTTNAFADNKALFDYVIIYGETTTSDESKTITTPTSTAGSNAKTPCYIYQKNGEDYQLISVVENANSSTKSWKGALQTNGGSLKVYITGFCPYASTGYTKADEGVWYFQGAEDENIDIYLEDCYIYSRYKSKRGNSFSRSNGETFSDKVARGSGAVLLFANTTNSSNKPLNVTIHTRGKNLLKSHYGCLYESIVGRAFQISSPVHVYMQSVDHYKNSYTELNFTDEWPISGGVERTNGFLSLQKQVNNAPSVDMGNMNTVVNFRGGQVELQNALNSSDNYESTLAISYRTGIYGPEKFKFTLAHGIGTDGVEGRVNFYDGTTTVKSMEVPERYRQYYLMDGENEELSTTSCLRSQKYTFVYGGSHCMMRACSEPTSKGGAPTDGDIVGGEATGNPLGLYQYPQSEGWTANGSYGLVTPTKFPGELQKDGNKLSILHATYPEAKYGVSSITPAAGNYLNLWVPSGYGVGKQPEVDQKISYWKACMTHIEASYGVYGGEIGGMTTIGTDAEGTQTELVYNLLYCEIDEDISGVITGSNAAIQYSATVLNPAPTENEDERYIEIPREHISVSDELQNYITNEHDYKVQTRVYYIVPAKADVWMNFTAPFDVENVYIMETFDESSLEKVQPIEDPFNPGEMFSKRESIKIEQAKHNADFAGFFGVALALESKKPFWDIYQDYMGWAKYTDKKEGRWNGSSPYTLRGKYKLRHYYQKTEKDPETGKDITTSNWNSSDYVLYRNTGAWEWDDSAYDGEGGFVAKWDFVIPTEGEPLMKQGQTYSLQFPYCTGCWNEDEDGNIVRDFWDYWTGKFLIFESTDGGADGHTIKGSSFVGSKFNGDWFDYDDSNSFLRDYDDYETGEQALLLGNQTFAMMGATQANLWTYDASPNYERFNSNTDKYGNPNLSEIKPTTSFLIADVQVPEDAISVKSIGRNGNITYNYGNPQGPTTGGHVPTVGGGNDMFITGIDGGINIAVAAPQMVCVVNATGHVLYNGYVTDNVNVSLPISGIYVVKGENEVQKIFF